MPLESLTKRLSSPYADLLVAQVFVWFSCIGRPVPVPRLTPLRAAQAADYAPLGRTGVRVWVEEESAGHRHPARL